MDSGIHEENSANDAPAEGEETPTPASPFTWTAGKDGVEAPQGSGASVASEAESALQPLTVPSTSSDEVSGENEEATTRKSGFRRQWWKLAIFGVVCALIGGLAGGLVANGSSNSLSIQSSSARPGAAVLPSGMTIPNLVKQVLPTVVSIDAKGQGSEDQGTGMIISSDGMVITNNHVIAIAAGSGGQITVTRSGSTASLPATLIGRNPADDVALIKITGVSGLPTVTLGNSDAVVVGDAAVAIGNALGLAAGTPTVTSGIISALGRTVSASDETGTVTETLTNMIQTDAAINPGNSGGPLLDSQGAVIGMNTAVAGSTSGSSAQNIGFAIPSARIISLLPSLEKGGTQGTSSGGFMGVEITTLTPDLRSQYGLVPTSGAVILSVQAQSPAATAGLREGDVIVSMDGQTITTAEQVIQITQSHQPGDKVKVTAQRGSQTVNTTVTLTSPPNS